MLPEAAVDFTLGGALITEGGCRGRGAAFGVPVGVFETTLAPAGPPLGPAAFVTNFPWIERDDFGFCVSVDVGVTVHVDFFGGPCEVDGELLGDAVALEDCRFAFWTGTDETAAAAGDGFGFFAFGT